MPTFSLKYQTAENIPAPFAHAIEINGNLEQDLSLSFEISYLDRESLSEEELFEEGFSTNDNFKWDGFLPKVWSDIVFGTLQTARELFIKSLEPHQDFWQIDFNNKSFYPKNSDTFKYLIEEIQQAVYEKAGKEKFLQITYLKNNLNEHLEVLVKASFVDRKLQLVRISKKPDTEETKILDWNELNYILKNTYSGEFDPDLAHNQRPSHNGLFINLGDELWFEVGKSILIQPNKLLKIMKI